MYRRGLFCCCRPFRVDSIVIIIRLVDLCWSDCSAHRKVAIGTSVPGGGARSSTDSETSRVACIRDILLSGKLDEVRNRVSEGNMTSAELRGTPHIVGLDNLPAPPAIMDASVLTCLGVVRIAPKLFLAAMFATRIGVDRIERVMLTKSSNGKRSKISSEIRSRASTRFRFGFAATRAVQPSIAAARTASGWPRG